MTIKLGQSYPCLSRNKIITDVKIIFDRDKYIRPEDKNTMGRFLGIRLDNGGIFGFHKNGVHESNVCDLRLEIGKQQ